MHLVVTREADEERPRTGMALNPTSARPRAVLREATRAGHNGEVLPPTVSIEGYGARSGRLRGRQSRPGGLALAPLGLVRPELCSKTPAPCCDVGGWETEIP